MESIEWLPKLRVFTEDDGLSTVVVGLPVRLDGSPNDSDASCCCVCRRTESSYTCSNCDGRRTTHEPRSRKPAGRAHTRLAATQGTTGCCRRRRHPAGLSRGTSGMKRTLAALVLLLAVGAGAAATWVYLGIERPFRGYTADELFVDIPPGLSTRAIGDRLVAAGIVRDSLTFRAALWMSGRKHPAEGRRVPLRGADLAAGGDRSAQSRRCLRHPHHVSRRPERLRDGEGLRVEGIRFRRVFRLRPVARLEGFLLPDTYALPRHTDAPKLVHQMNQAFEHALTPEIRAAAAARNLNLLQLVTLASIVEKETGNPSERPHRRVGLPKPPAHRDAAAVRSDGHLCARARGPVPRQHSPRRFIARLSVQHLPVPRIAAGPHCRRRASPRWTPSCIQSSRTICTSSAATTDRTCLRKRSPNTVTTSSAIRSSTSGPERRQRLLLRRRAGLDRQERQERHDGEEEAAADTEAPILPIPPFLALCLYRFPQFSFSCRTSK